MELRGTYLRTLLEIFSGTFLRHNRIPYVFAQRDSWGKYTDMGSDFVLESRTNNLLVIAE